MSFNKKSELKEIAKQLCRELRKSSTPAEEIFWDIVRDDKLKGYKFYRQHPIFFCFNERESFYIADFYCHSKKLVVEIDGEIHKYKKDYDNLRTEIINLLGIDVLRINNSELIEDETSVRSKLLEILK
jgi:very-short-patch-repair endonuclease